MVVTGSGVAVILKYVGLLRDTTGGCRCESRANGGQKWHPKWKLSLTSFLYI